MLHCKPYHIIYFNNKKKEEINIVMYVEISN